MKTDLSRKRVSCRPLLNRIFTPGKPSTFGIKSVNDLPSGTKVFCAVRESSDKQRSGLVDQLNSNIEAVRQRGSKVVDHWSIVVPAHDTYFIKKSVELAKEAGATAIVIESVSRAIRNDYFSPTCLRELQPTNRELRGMVDTLDGLDLYTVLDPDATAKDERDFEKARRRSQRPYKSGPSRNRRGWASDSDKNRLRLLLAEGHSVCSAARQMGIPKSTAYDIKKRL